jgi:hypothetical protein
MGVINIEAFEKLAKWFLRSTGGTVSSNLASSVSVSLQKRTNSGSENPLNVQNLVLNGISRVTYLAGIEISNFFLTSYIWFVIACLLIIIFICLSKFVHKILVKRRKLIVNEKPAWNQHLKCLFYQLVRI